MKDGHATKTKEVKQQQRQHSWDLRGWDGRRKLQRLGKLAHVSKHPRLQAH